MVSNGELAQRTGTTPRMLRHWEMSGLLPPADTDPRTGRRTYDPAQEGRVQTIVALRANGFGLDAIRDLLDSGTDHDRLRAVLDARRSTLSASIARDNAALRRLDRRIASLDRSRSAIADTLEVGPLPALRGTGLRTTVSHESEIPAAVRRLVIALAAPAGTPMTFVYDGMSHPRAIDVSVLCDHAGATASIFITVPEASTGATVRLPERPVDLGDTWMALDAVLLPRGFTTRGPYRQVVDADGAVSLAVPVLPIPDAC